MTSTIPVVDREPVLTRRQFLVAGGLTAGALMLPGCVGASTPAPTTSAFRSRPDLRPPKLSVTTRHASIGLGHLFFTVGGPLMMDNDGGLLWYHPLSGPHATTFRPQRYRGAPVLAWWEGEVDKAGYGRGEYVIVDSSYREITRVRAGNGYQGDLHEFVITPRDTALFTVYQPGTADLSTVGGPAEATILDGIVQEVDIATGAVLFEWRAKDHVGFDESHAVMPTGSGQLFDFFHINSIYSEANGDLVVSARNTWAVYKISRQSGEVVWRLGGKKNDFSSKVETAFEWQHDARRHHDGTITLFDNGATPQVELQSRGLVMAIDEGARSLTLQRELLHARVLASSQGSVQRLPGGNFLVGWGDQPYVSEFDGEGRLVFDARFPTGFQSYRSFRLSWVGRPSEPPAIAVDEIGLGRLTMHVSWNGATEVARWDVLAGRRKDSLERIASAPRSGFETKISAITTDRYVAARAHDASGAVLGTSAVRTVAS
ncbi:MAG: Arylsulfotransferase [Acidimicrobiales bacterium]|jgi:hypothetical protein|nr:Arylsulfotransferase [Acidimicrobiales bacterium]